MKIDEGMQKKNKNENKKAKPKPYSAECVGMLNELANSKKLSVCKTKDSLIEAISAAPCNDKFEKSRLLAEVSLIKSDADVVKRVWNILLESNGLGEL